MANIIDELNTLNTNLDNAKFKLAKNLKDKGVQALPSDKLDALADKVTTIPSGNCNLQELNVTENGTYTPQAGDVKGYNKVTVNVPQSGGGDQLFDFKSIGYTGNEEPIKSGLAYAQKIKNEWDASKTDLGWKFRDDKKLVYMPLVDTSKVYNMQSMFMHCGSLNTIPKLNTSKVTNMNDIFGYCNSLTTIPLLDTSKVTNMGNIFEECINLITIPQLDTHNATNMSNMFYKCKSLTSVPQLDISNATNMNYMFDGCSSLTSIKFIGDPSKVTNMSSMFGASYSHLADNGTLIYDYRYDYSKIIEELHKYNPTWAIKPSYEPQECTSLSITADDCIGNATTTTIHYTAVTNGVNSFTGERVENITLTGNAISEPFEMNPSYDTSRQVTITFTYLGCSATTTITQGVKLPPTASVNLQDQWKQSDNSLIPNPDSLIYDGVYESFSNKGKYDSNAQMKIDFVGMPEVEIYLRNGGSNTSEIYVGNLDSETASNSNNQFKVTTYGQKGTDIGSYTKYVIKNDGSKHSVIIGYYKGYGGHTEPDCAYLLIKKPQE